MVTARTDHKAPVLILAYVYPPDNYAGAARPHRFAKYLERLGHPVSIVAAGPPGATSAAGNVYRVPGELEGRHKTLADKVVRLAWLYYDEGVAWIPGVVRLAARWRDLRPVLFSTSPPITTHLAALWLKRRYGWKWMADFRDPLAGNPFRKLRRVQYSDAVLEKIIFRQADTLIANTDSVEALWRRRYPHWGRKIALIWNGFDAEDPAGGAPMPPREFRVLAHAGEIYGDRHPGLVLASVARLTAQGSIQPDRLRIQLVGPVAQEALPDAALVEGLTRCGCLELKPAAVPRAEAQRLTAEAYQLLLLDVLSGSAGLQVPGKIFDYIRIGRPVLASTTRGSPAERILEQSGIPHGCIYPDLGEPEIDRRVLEFLKLPSTPVAPSAWFQSQFDAARQAEALSDLIQALSRG
jgi:glycosyltransferase involved in cell wall biosynthesis